MTHRDVDLDSVSVRLRTVPVREVSSVRLCRKISVAPGYWEPSRWLGPIYAGLPSPLNHEDHSEGDPDYDEDEPEAPCLQLFAIDNKVHSAGQILAIANAHHDLESDSKQNHMENEGR